MRTLFVLLLLLTTPGVAQAQSFQQKYGYAKTLFKEGKYNLAQEAFKELIPYQEGNPFSRYASFITRSALTIRVIVPLRATCFCRSNPHPQWNQIDEVNLWLARIYFDEKIIFRVCRLW